jgi:hypothetical protein
MFDKWSMHTYSGITERFAGGRWIKVQLQDYEAQTSLMRTVETIRHTARAAEIMLMIDKGHSIIRQVALDLIQEASSLQNPDGGWKEFRVGNQVSSLYSSLYVFHFLSTLRSHLLSQSNGDFFKDFVEENSTCIDKTEEYLKTHWKTQKWKYGSLPWEVSAPGTLSEYAPYALNLMLVQQVRDSITELLNKNGRLIHPDIGVPFDAPEYSFTVRIVYALCCAKQKLKKSDDRIDAAISWLRESYSPSLMLNTCDVAFLSEMLLEN